MKTQLIRWIVINQHPFTIVEEPSFISLVYTLCPTAKIPSADTIKRYIMNSYEINKEKVQLFLQNLPGKISFTMDIWTSPTTKSFLSITAHFLNKEWELQSIIVDFVQIYGSHTGENIKNIFISCLNDLLIQNKVIYYYYYYYNFNIN